MTSKIKVDNINKVSDDSNIIKKCGSTTTVGSGSGNTIVVCGSTVTIGRCGGTVSLASGASQSGFGRSGSVDWQTGDIKTATFTASSGEGYFANTTSGVFNMNLPAGSAGAIVAIQDYNNTFDTNSLTIVPNGTEKINGNGGTLSLSVEGQGVTFVYIDGVVGWRSVQENEFAQQAQSRIVATGGCVTTTGDFKMHKFTGPGTFCVSSGGGAVAVVDYLVVAGGGSGGGGDSHGGGGGGGGFRLNNTLGCVPAPTMSPLTVTCAPSAIPVSPGAIPVTVGGGGAATPPSHPISTANRGSPSVFSTITSAGGGGGNPNAMQGGPGATPCNTTRGGSGGGGGSSPSNSCTTGLGALGNIPPTSPPQGQPGSNANYDPPNYGSGGGGGAGGTGSNGTSTTGGAGGVGSFVNPIFAPSCAGTPGPTPGVRYFSGGGGGSTFNGGSPGAGASGGGGAGGTYPTAGTNGTANSGGGAGGGSYSGGTSGTGGAGGSGYVLIRYKFQ